MQQYGDREALEIYPQLIEAAEAPVIDTACGALLKLAERVHANGQKVVLTGEGADEWLVGYPWYKAAKLMGFLDAVPGLNLSDWARSRLPAHEQGAAFSAGMAQARGEFDRWTKRLGRSYGLLAISKLRFYSEQMRDVMDKSHPWGELGFPIEKAKRWRRSIAGYGSRRAYCWPAIFSRQKAIASPCIHPVEVRYPFLDEDVFDFTARLHPRWKLRGLRDSIFAAPARRALDSETDRASWQSDLSRAARIVFTWTPSRLSWRSLSATIAAPHRLLRCEGSYALAQKFSRTAGDSLPRLSVEMGLAAVVATQLWHHQLHGRRTR